jgi:hypothetical protein
MVAVVLLDVKGFERACFRRPTLDTLPLVYMESTKEKSGTRREIVQIAAV